MHNLTKKKIESRRDSFVSYFLRKKFLIKSLMEKKEIEKSQNIMKYIIYSISQMNEDSTLEEKINLSAYIISNKDFVINESSFYEEECQVSLLDWVYRERKNLTEENIDFFNLYDLLFNVIIILESFPIQIDFINSCNFIRKLKNIYFEVKEINSPIKYRIKELVSYWEKIQKAYEKSQISEEENTMLGNKRKRDDAIEKKQEISDSENDSEETRHTKIKKVSWKNELIEVKIFCTKDPPHLEFVAK